MSRCVPIIVMSVVLSSVAAHAQETVWIDPAGGDFHTDGHWSAGVPDAASDAVFDVAYGAPPDPATTIYVVTFGADAFSDLISVDTDTVTFTLDGFAYHATGLAVGAGSTGGGSLTLVGGTVETADGTQIGATGGARGTLVVGAHAHLDLAGSGLEVGTQGPGTIRITDAGRLTSADTDIGTMGGTGTLDVDGTGSLWTSSDGLTVGGNQGAGLVRVTGGGGVVAGPVVGTAIFGEGADSHGTVLIDGPASFWHRQGHLTVGGEGTGRFEITAGADAAVDSLKMADAPDSKGTVFLDGDGSRLTYDSAIEIGVEGTALLTVSGGATLTGAGGDGSVVAKEAESSATVAIGGQESEWWEGDSLTVGGAGQGALTVSNGGALTVEGPAILGGQTTGAGTVTVRGGGSTLTSETLEVGSHGTATLRLEEGGRLHQTMADPDASTLIIGGNPSASGQLLVDGPGSGWHGVDNVNIGHQGMGAFALSGGAAVACDDACLGRYMGATGNATVSGAGTIWTVGEELRIGGAGAGSLVVVNGGRVIGMTDHLTLTSGEDSEAHLVVDGHGSLLETQGNALIGKGGDGALVVSGGGQVRVGTDLAVGNDNAPSSLTVLGAGSLCRAEEDLTVAGFGSASVLAADGARLSVRNATFGRTEPNTPPYGWPGSGHITGAGTRLEVQEHLTITGHPEASTLHVTDGAAVVVGDRLSVHKLAALIIQDASVTAGSIGVLEGCVTLDDGLLKWPQDSHVISKAWFELSGAARLQAVDCISNYGRFLGHGTIEVGHMYNKSGAVIEAVGGTMTFGGSTVNQSGCLISATAGTRLLFGEGLTNDGGGIVSLPGGTIETPDGEILTNAGQIVGYGVLRTGDGLTNSGDVVLTGGTTTLNGPVTNAPAGEIEIAHQPAIFTGPVVNYGYVKVRDTTATFAGGFTNNGTYDTDPSLSRFTDVQVGPSGVFIATAGDRFVVEGDFLSASGASGEWSTTEADLHFRAGADDLHAMDVTGAGGGGWTDNFAWGGVTLEVAQTVTLADGNATPGASLYTSALTLEAGARLEGAAIGVVAEGIAATGGTSEIAADVLVETPLGIDVASAAELALTGLLTGTGAHTMTKTGDGLLIISGPQDHAPDSVFQIAGGTVEMHSDAAGSAGGMDEADLSILVDGAELVFGCDQYLDTLDIRGEGLVRLTGANVVVVRNLVMNGVPLGPTTLTPEPATLALLAAGVAVVLRRRRG